MLIEEVPCAQRQSPNRAVKGRGELPRIDSEHGGRAHTTPALLRWARETAACTIEDAAHKIGVKPETLALAEEGDHRITLKQAQKAADTAPARRRRRGTAARPCA